MKTEDTIRQDAHVGAAWTAEAPNCTSTTAVADCATGTNVCITMHNWQ